MYNTIHIALSSRLYLLKHHTCIYYVVVKVSNHYIRGIIAFFVPLYTRKKLLVNVTRYRTGPGVIPSKVPQDVRNLVVVLNGRTTSKVEYAQMWLTYIPAMESVQNVIIVLLGEY